MNDSIEGGSFESSERILEAPISYEVFIALAKEYRLPEIVADVTEVIDDDHGFYILLEKLLPQHAVFDGVSMLDLYKRNVIEGQMSHEDFRLYCHRNQLPHPAQSNGEVSEYAKVIEQAYDQIIAQHRSEYEARAAELGLITTAGAMMRFTDHTELTYDLGTDYDTLHTALQELE